MEKKRLALHHLMTRQSRIPIRGALRIYHNKLEQMNYILLNKINIVLDTNRAKNRELTLRMEALNPLNVLKRGYSITRSLPARRVVKTSAAVAIDQQVEIQLASGALLCRVEGK
jgi:exodeoxyribonuclease VII large subunit